MPGHESDYVVQPFTPNQRSIVVRLESSLDYCVIINASVKTISSFSLEWSTGPRTPPYTMPSVGFSAPSVSVSHGQNATFPLTLRSLHGFRGNVTFSLGGGLYAWLNPRSVLVKS